VVLDYYAKITKLGGNMAFTKVQQAQISGSLSFNDALGAGSSLASRSTLAGDLDALRSQVKRVLGQTNWYDDLAGSQNLSAIYTAVHMDGTKANFQGAIDVAGVADFDSAAYFAGAVGVSGSLAVAQAATFANGASISGAALDVNADLTANKISIDGDVASRLYIVDSDGSIKDESKLVFDGSAMSITGGLYASGPAGLSGSLDVAGIAKFAAAISGSAGLEISAGGASISGGAAITGDLTVTEDAAIMGDLSTMSDLAVAGNSELVGTLAVTGSVHMLSSARIDGILDVNNVVSASALKIDGDVAQRLYIVDSDGSLKDESKLIFDGSAMSITGGIYASGPAGLSGSLQVAGMAGFAQAVSMASTLTVTGATTLNGGLSMDSGAFSVQDGTGNVATAGSLSVAGGAQLNGGLTMDTDKFVVADGTGNTSIAGTLGVLGAAQLGSTLGVTGAVTLSSTLSAGASTLSSLGVTNNATVGGTLGVTGAATFSAGAAINGAALDVNADLTSNKISIDGDVAQRLYIVDSDGSIKDEAKLTFDGSKLDVTGDIRVSGNAQVDGNLLVKGAFTYVETENMKVKDAFIYLATGSNGSVDSGIVLSKGAGASYDLVVGQDGGAGELIFAQVAHNADGTTPADLNGAALVKAWMSGSYFGNAEGTELGHAGISAGAMELKSAAGVDLMLVARGDESFKLASDGDQAQFEAQFGAGVSLVDAIISAASGGNFKQDAFLPGVVAADTNIAFSSVGTLRAASVADDAAKKLAMDVYLNGVRLSYGDDYIISSTTQLQLKVATVAEDRIFVAIHNAA
jgi:hypothetical protein